MKKIFEIPIYALSRKELGKRIEKEKNAFIAKNNCISSEKAEDVFNNQLALYKRIWDYNHIVGYIQIIKLDNEIRLELYFMVNPDSKYYWNSNKKKFLKREFVNGCNIYLGQYKDNKQVIEHMDSLIAYLRNKHIPRRCYVDTEVYENIKEYIDYKKI